MDKSIAYTWRVYAPDGTAHDGVRAFRRGAFMSEALPYFAGVAAIMREHSETRVYLGEDTKAAPLLTFCKGTTEVKKGPRYLRHVASDFFWEDTSGMFRMTPGAGIILLTLISATIYSLSVYFGSR